MKRYLTALLITVTVLLTGCLGEDWSLCEADDNCVLLFRYRDISGEDLFAANIESVDLFVFDENYYYVEQLRVEKSDLEVFQGITLHLDPGTYNIVCWGNIDNNATYSISEERSAMGETVVQTKASTEGSPLFYAPYKTITTRGSMTRTDTDYSVHNIEVPKSGIVQRELNFMRAFRKMNVFIDGYIKETGGHGPQFEITLTNLAYAYDCLLRVYPERTDYRLTAVEQTTPDGTLPGITLKIPYHDISDDIFIDITASDDLICPPINLAEYISTQGLPADPLQLHEITILVKFEKGVVTITTPDWGENEVTPDLNRPRM